MSELLDKQVNAQKRKTSRVHINSSKPTKKVCDENEESNKETRKKRCTCENGFNGRKWFISCTSETDCYKMLLDNS